MEESLKQLWTISTWFMGISTTVTLFIFGYLLKLHGKISVAERIEQMSKDLGDIKKALVGDYENKGLITKHHELENRVDDLESSKN